MYTYIHIYVYKTESLCCIPETSTPLEINYISIKKNFFRHWCSVPGDDGLNRTLKASCLETKKSVMAGNFFQMAEEISLLSRVPSLPIATHDAKRILKHELGWTEGWADSGRGLWAFPGP